MSCGTDTTFWRWSEAGILEKVTVLHLLPEPWGGAAVCTIESKDNASPTTTMMPMRGLPPLVALSAGWVVYCDRKRRGEV